MSRQTDPAHKSGDACVQSRVASRLVRAQHIQAVSQQRAMEIANIRFTSEAGRVLRVYVLHMRRFLGEKSLLSTAGRLHAIVCTTYPVAEAGLGSPLWRCRCNHSLRRSM